MRIRFLLLITMVRCQHKRGEMIQYIISFYSVCTRANCFSFKSRVENLNKFKNEDGDCPTLVCTDLAARGLDLDVDHVIMFDFPLNSVSISVVNLLIVQYFCPFPTAISASFNLWGLNPTFFCPFRLITCIVRGELLAWVQKVHQFLSI